MGRDRRKSICSFHNLAEALDHPLAVIEDAAFNVDPAEPIRAAEEDATGVEGSDGLEFCGRQWANCRVSGEADAAGLCVVTGEAAEESGHVAGGSFDLHRAEIDQAGDSVAGEQDVIVPDVAEARLEVKRHANEWLQLGDGGWNRSRQSSDKLPRERQQRRPNVWAECLREFVNAALRELAKLVEAMGEGGGGARI